MKRSPRASLVASELVRTVDLRPFTTVDHGKERVLSLRVEIHQLASGGFQSSVCVRDFYRMQPSFHLARRADERLWVDDVMFVWEGPPAASADLALASTVERITAQLAPVRTERPKAKAKRGKKR